jgi:murein L,D-transpeptidase YcbB/YkuD
MTYNLSMPSIALRENSLDKAEPQQPQNFNKLPTNSLKEQVQLAQQKDCYNPFRPNSDGNILFHPLSPPLEGQQGTESSLVQAIRTYLIQRGYLEADQVSTETTYYEGALVDAVIKFQSNNNLEPDGIVGEATWDALAGSCE